MLSTGSGSLVHLCVRGEAHRHPARPFPTESLPSPRVLQPGSASILSKGHGEHSRQRVSRCCFVPSQQQVSDTPTTAAIERTFR
ncbi:hypothetical protein BDA96_01G459500 [Sorghum bicolor]|uniref:Uncharacterized protein n=1 Tax=Sorghum bicolor TaxID=4558 RepID=A0A921S7G4_SORBI|nr:hypothetical protein BDA96_01G459500 [Sorghum bicolor]